MKQKTDKKLDNKKKVIYKAKDYKDREDLDRQIYSDFGYDLSNKENAIIKGSKQELTRLHLSETSTIYNVEVMVQ